MFWLRKCDFRGFFHTERSLLRLNKAFRFFNFLQRRKGERLSWFAFSSWCGTFDRSWLHHWQIDTDGYWISPCWTGFVGLVKSIFATLNQCTCLGYFIAALMNWYNWPKLQIFQPHELQTRSEYWSEVKGASSAIILWFWLVSYSFLEGRPSATN